MYALIFKRSFLLAGFAVLVSFENLAKRFVFQLRIDDNL